ncbi:hypothetical protein PPL_04951 [Heterostelium album PN500]|uniref:Uncharacterized protein n=1 Tax=Heterostelium pallidum (strain ATCC 26659 / Pp 5 / PN500) TaxID=670386 RepID=D3B907_HETP5|nr:hypothetical protein PPL_04951 [Heterostelium album PN500]EFA82046.1 hypothetical protein PPL_04951 [Heterostelium album PN500]|eukprot:XP_020434163.1 hypothetical protein PPL_04951 [Heterostelium album PN500]
MNNSSSMIFKTLVVLLAILGVCNANSPYYLVIANIGYTNGDCNGDVHNAYSYQVNTCANGVATYCSPNDNVGTIASFFDNDCSSSPLNIVTYPLGCNGQSLVLCQQGPFNNHSASTYARYEDSACQTAPTFTQTYISKVCNEGVVTTCDDTSTTITTFENSDCSGKSTSMTHTLKTQCHTGTQGYEQTNSYNANSSKTLEPKCRLMTYLSCTIQFEHQPYIEIHFDSQ